MCLPCSDDERDVLVEEVAESISEISVWTATLTFPMVVGGVSFYPWPSENSEIYMENGRRGEKLSLCFRVTHFLTHKRHLKSIFVINFVFQSIFHFHTHTQHNTARWDYGNFPVIWAMLHWKLKFNSATSKSSGKTLDIYAKLLYYEKHATLGFMNGRC